MIFFFSNDKKDNFEMKFEWAHQYFKGGPYFKGAHQYSSM